MLSESFSTVRQCDGPPWRVCLRRVIAAVSLLDERSIDEIVAKLRPGELEQVIKLVGRSPRCYPPGTLDALKSHRQVPSPEPVASTSTNVASRQPAAPMKPNAEHMRQAREHRSERPFGITFPSIRARSSGTAASANHWSGIAWKTGTAKTRFSGPGGGGKKICYADGRLG
jgi:hypothetical protein